jgi:hypothetical protein
LPSWSVAAGGMPRLHSSAAIALLPLMEDKCSAVLPCRSAAAGFAPASSSATAIARLLELGAS